MSDVIKRAAQMIAELAEMATALRETTAELEQARVQLAGCLTAAEGAIREPAKQGDYGWSLAYQKTLELRTDRDQTVLEAMEMRVVELEGRAAPEEAAEPSTRTCRIDVEPLRIYLWGDAREMPYLRELADGNFEKVYPADWPTPPGPKRPNIIMRREALRGGARR